MDLLGRVIVAAVSRGRLREQRRETGARGTSAEEAWRSSGANVGWRGLRMGCGRDGRGMGRESPRIGLNRP